MKRCTIHLEDLSSLTGTIASAPIDKSASSYFLLVFTISLRPIQDPLILWLLDTDSGKMISLPWTYTSALDISSCESLETIGDHTKLKSADPETPMHSVAVNAAVGQCIWDGIGMHVATRHLHLSWNIQVRGCPELYINRVHWLTNASLSFLIFVHI